MFVYMDIKPIKLSYGNFSDTKYQLYVLIWSLEAKSKSISMTYKNRKNSQTLDYVKPNQR